MSALHLVTDVPEVTDIADGLLDLEEAISELKDRRAIPLAYLYETIGKPMLAKGQKTKTIDGIKYHCEPPRQHLICTCHATFVYFCPNGENLIGTKWATIDDKPRFYLTRATKETD